MPHVQARLAVRRCVSNCCLTVNRATWLPNAREIRACPIARARVCAPSSVARVHCTNKPVPARSPHGAHFGRHYDTLHSGWDAPAPMFPLNYGRLLVAFARVCPNGSLLS